MHKELVSFGHLGRLDYLVGRFVCNTRVIVNANSDLQFVSRKLVTSSVTSKYKMPFKTNQILILKVEFISSSSSVKSTCTAINIRGKNLERVTENKCFNVHVQVEIVKKNKGIPFPSLAFL